MFGAGVSPPAPVLIAIVFAGVFGLLAQNQTYFFMILACFAPFILHDFIVENKETNKENAKLRERVYSLEDRIVKNILRNASKQCVCPDQIPECICEHKASMKVISNKIIKPTESEIKENPRSRSAKLRLAEKL